MARSLLEDVPEQTFTAETIKRMYRLVHQAVTDPAFQKLIYGIVNGKMRGKWKDYRGELATVLSWFKRNVDYRRDPYGVELLQDVWATLDRGRGDCDDATVFLCAAAQVLGSPTRIVTVSTRPDKEPVHVYPEAQIRGKWLGLDATVPGSFVGWKPPSVTDTRIWTRSELGLAGDDDNSTFEGLGMNGNGNGNGKYDFGTMTPVSGRLAPGVPDDISKTYAPGIPGVTNVTGRRIWRAPVANNSEWTSNPRPGGGVYGPALPVDSMPTPSKLWSLIDRAFVPKILNPDSAWWGKVPTSREDLNRMFPGSEGTMANYVKDIASVPASAIASVVNDVKKQLATGEIGLAHLNDAIREGLEDYAAGRPLRMQLPPGQRVRRGWTNEAGRAARGVSERRYLVPAPQKGLMARPRRLEGLGDVFDDAAKALSTGVQTGQVPPGGINQAINSVVAAITGQPTAPPPAPSSLTTLIPLGVIALLGLAAYSMSGGGKSRSYKRNPSRRRSYRRSYSRGGGGGIDPKKLILWGGGGLAAYMLLFRPGSPLMPAMPRPGVQPASVFQPVAQAIPSLVSSISKLFSSGSSSSTSPSGGSGMITSYSQLQPSTPAPAPDSSGFVTSLT